MTDSLDHQLTINTPEQVTLEYHLAGIGSRFIAFLIDSLIQGIGFAAIIIAGAVSSLAFATIFNSTWAIAILVFLWFAVYWGYFAVFEALWNGQTPGKRSVGIRVVKESGRGIRASEAISRNLMRAIDQLPGIYVFGLISMIISKENKRLGDYVAGTVVVHEKPAEEVHPDLQALDSPIAVGAWALNLNERDLELIETFLQRRLSLEGNVRYVTAMRIKEFIQKKSGQTPSPGQSDEDFLNDIAVAIRNSRSR